MFAINILDEVGKLRLPDIIFINNNDRSSIRQYEFKLDEDAHKRGWAFFNLFIKTKDQFFKPQTPYYYLHNESWQVVPISFEVLMEMTDQEIMILHHDIVTNLGDSY